MTTAIQQTIPANSAIKPWLMLGPFYQNVADQVEGLTLFENSATQNGRGVLNSCVEAAKSILTSKPTESDMASYAGQDMAWELVRRPEPMLMWGRYNIANHLGAAFLSTCIHVEKGGKTVFKLNTRISSRIQIFLDSCLIFDSDKAQSSHRAGTIEYGFDADLSEGNHVLNVGLFRMGRMAQVGMRLTCNCDLTAQISTEMPLTERAAIEADVQALRLERDLFYPDHQIGVHLGQLLQSGARLVCQLIRGNTTLKTVRRQPKRAGLFRLCQASDIGDGSYELVCAFEHASGRVITQVRFNLQVLTPTQAMPGLDKWESRKKMLLEHFASKKSGGHGGIWPAVAQYALGQTVDEEAIRNTCLFIQNRLDCADFAIQGVLRLAYWDQKARRLSPEIHAMIKDTLLGFKYWVDEPGDTVMFMGSENHRLLFHVAEFLAGQLYPTEEFTNSRQRGLYHVTKARMFLMEWLRQRGRFGFDEWHSNSYYPVNISPLINLFDFPLEQDYALRHLAESALHTMFFNLAADAFHGVFGTTHGRSYAYNLIYPDREGTGSTCWLLFGEGSLHGGSGMGSISTATSRYRLPVLFDHIAQDRQTVVESRQQQGSHMRAKETANFVVYRTPDYMLCGLQDHRKGEYESSTHVAQATFEDKVVVFFSCPHTSGEGSGLRPDYWSGHTTLPRVIQHKNVLSHTWRLTEFAWMTHCFFEQDRFDEVIFDGNWVFAKKNQAYLGIWSQNGMAVGSTGQYAGRELVCYASKNTWIVECGRQADWGDFKSFVNSLRSASVTSKGETVMYQSPSVGAFVTGWDVEPTVAGKPIPLCDYPLIDSPFGQARYGSGEMVYTYGKEKLDLWFNF